MLKKHTKTDSRKILPRAAIYCRVSTFDQNRGDYISLEDQETRLRRSAEADGYEVFQVFKEVIATENAAGETRIATAGEPPRLIESYAGASLLALIVTNRFGDHSPYYRDEDILSRLGYPLLALISLPSRRC